jgi:uncharacterized protein YwgA
MNNAEKAAAVIQDAGGRVIGRTKLQKITYLLCAAGLEDGFDFEYRHYGPYSENLSDAIAEARLGGLVSEDERSAQWGGSYSIYQTTKPLDRSAEAVRLRLVQLAASADAVVLELAATAVYLARQGNPDPWKETARRKPEKASGRLDRAAALLAELRSVKVPSQLPAI